MVETSDHAVASPFPMLRRVVPWIVLAVVLLRVFSWYGAYRASQDAWEAQASKAKPSEVASAAAAAKKGAAAATDAKPAQPPGSKVVIVSDVTLRKDPASGAQPMRDLKTGEQLTYLGQLGPWYKVSDQEGKTGWVSASERYTKLVSGK